MIESVGKEAGFDNAVLLVLAEHFGLLTLKARKSLLLHGQRGVTNHPLRSDERLSMITWRASRPAAVGAIG